MNRREFLMGAAAVTGLTGCAGAKCGCGAAGAAGASKILFGACRPIGDAKLMKAVGYDFIERDVAWAFVPEKGEEEWKARREEILSSPLPVRSCNGFLPGKFRLTGPKADFEPALKYAETALRRADEVGVVSIVFGSGGARNVPGDYLAKWGSDARPDVEKGTRQYAEFCRELCKRTADLKTVAVTIEPLRPNESNIINYVWQGVQICQDVDSPRLRQLADIFHMMMGRESPDSIRQAGALLKHCHVASYDTRKFPGSDPATVMRLKPYFDALKDIGYAGGVSCECGWGDTKDLEKNLTTALATMKSLV